MERILITGGAGFIGSNLVRYLREQRPDWELINLDKLTYAGNLDNLADIPQDDRYRFVRGDICDRDLVRSLMPGCDGVIHLAAESHVDRSIADSRPFIDANVMGTQVLLDAAREFSVRRFLHVSTDEVYGSLPVDVPELKFGEHSPLAPSSPYAASKAASDLLVQAAWRTFKLPVCITRCSNNFGPYQFPEKVIPLFVTNLLQGKRVPLYGDGKNVRDWIHVLDHCEALLAVLERGKPGSVYNIGADNEHANIDLTHAILRIMNQSAEMIEPVEDRLGHDRRYAIDAKKIERDLDWRPTRSAWPDALRETVQWYIDHEPWWRRIQSGACRNPSEKPPDTVV